MKKTAKILTSILLLVSVVLSFVSCRAVGYIISCLDTSGARGYSEWYEGCPVPEGYTGGFNKNYQYHTVTEIKWLETYDEMVDAVTRLRAHGTEIDPIALFDCEEYGFDLKFCMEFNRPKEPLSEGQGYFDRKLIGVIVNTYVFFEDITIEKLVYSAVDMYKNVSTVNNRYHSDLTAIQSTDTVTIEEVVVLDDLITWYSVHCNATDLFTLTSSSCFKLTEEQIEILEKTLVVIT